METSKYYNSNLIISEIHSALTRAKNLFAELSNWQVVRANQPTIQAIQNDTIYFDIISKRRYGVQGSKPKKIDGEWTMESVWLEEILIQVSAFKQRNPETDDVYTITSSDAISLIQGVVNAQNSLGNVFNGDIENPRLFEKKEFNVIRSTDMREIEFETDSGLKDKFPQFDFLLVVEQRLLKKMENIATIELETKRI